MNNITFGISYQYYSSIKDFIDELIVINKISKFESNNNGVNQWVF